MAEGTVFGAGGYALVLLCMIWRSAGHGDRVGWMALTAQGDSDVTMDSASTLFSVADVSVCKLVQSYSSRSLLLDLLLLLLFCSALLSLPCRPSPPKSGLLAVYL